MIPTDVPFPTERIVGADAMHVALCAILRHSGHRTNVPYDGAAPHDDTSDDQVSVETPG